MIALIAVLALVANPVGEYNRGNQLYAGKDYAGAARAYEQALEAGPSAKVHFNLGNALFKSGRIGPAIAHYRRARYLSPRDSDIAANLDFARAYRVDKTTAAQGPLARALDATLHRLSRREAAILSAISFAFAGALFSAWIVWRGAAPAVAAALLGATSLYGLLVQQAWTAEVTGRPAVVVAPEVNALSGPGTDFKEILLLHDGSEVRIREARGDYLLVQLPGGGGWVPKDTVEPVY